MEQQPAKDDIMVSFDVVSLFTQVPVGEALTIIQTKYKLPEYIVELIKHCLSNTYFTYEGQQYMQVQTAPMGSPLSPALANLFMEDLEEKVVMTSTHKPKL
jgi:Reverse transcriptase (RNA-dependent DNA polymerase).